MKAQDADVVRRLLDNDMIFDGGKLTPHALQLCQELEPEEIKVDRKFYRRYRGDS